MSLWPEVAQAIRRVARQEGGRAGVRIERYRVVDASPLTLTALGGEEVLEEGDEHFEIACDPEALSVGDVVMVLESGGVDVALGPVDEEAPPSSPRLPTTAEKAALPGTNGAPGAGNRYVTDSDPRNTNARAPTAHGHPQSDIVNLVADLAAKQSAATSVNDGDAAGGVLSGTYPSPGFAVDMATQAELDAIAAVSAKPPVVTALPGSPTTGDEVYLQTAAMKAQGVAWHMRYDSTLATTQKWVCLGGGMLTVSWANAQTFNPIGGGTQLTTETGDVQLPVSGLYEVTGRVHGGSSVFITALFNLTDGTNTINLGQLTNAAGQNGYGAGAGIGLLLGGTTLKVSFNWPGHGGAWTLQAAGARMHIRPVRLA